MSKNIGLFIPCYVNTLYPNVGIASYKLLKSFDFSVDYPSEQTCCGQPMANGGFEKNAKKLAEKFCTLFNDFDYIVGPSSSCVAFIKHHYGNILGKHHKHLNEILDKTYDICAFLHDIVQPKQLNARFNYKVSLHNSCHGVRELRLSSASELNIPPFSKLKNLLSLVRDIQVFEPPRVDECCGFGGLFAIEEAAVSANMGSDKIQNHISTGATYITGADSSCLMHLQGLIDRKKSPIRTIHITEILSTNL